MSAIGATIRERRDLSLPPPRSIFKVHNTLNAKVIVIKLVPGFDDESIGALITHSSSLKALVLELFGTGNGPAKRQSLLDAIELAHSKGMCLECLNFSANYCVMQALWS